MPRPRTFQSAIDAAGGYLPKNLPLPPSYRKVNPAESAIVIFAIHSDALPLTVVDDYAENVILPRMSQILGVGQVSIGGHGKEARGPGASRPGQDRRARHSARGSGQRHLDGHCQCAEGNDQWLHPQLRRLRQIPTSC